MISFEPFAEKYRPTTLQDCIITSELRDTFQSFVNSKQFPNLLLSGRPGTGKTTIAKVLCNELDADYIIINASKDGNIDTLRTKIQDFCSTLSMSGNQKVVILDEADYLTNATQPALRNFIESYSANCKFILTCNYKNRIIEALHSRLAYIDFNLIDKEEKKDLIKQFFTRVCFILSTEKIEFDKKSVLVFISKYFPDMRKILNEQVS
jgi:DNA polymerase III delta prime subunit